MLATSWVEDDEIGVYVGVVPVVKGNSAEEATALFTTSDGDALQH